MVLTLEITAELESQLAKQARQLGIDPQALVVRMLREQLLTPSKSENELLEEINTGIPTRQWERCQELKAKRRAEALTEDEQAELCGISDQLEESNVSRIQSLAELARRRQVTLSTLMDQLGINPIAAG